MSDQLAVVSWSDTIKSQNTGAIKWQSTNWSAVYWSLDMAWL